MMAEAHNGMPASDYRARWRKSHYSNPNGSCEVAELPGGIAVAIRAIPAVLR
jgi:hypothetical protein